LDQIALRIPAYGTGSIPLASLASIKPAHHGEPGFELELYDPDIAQSFKKSLAAAAKPLSLKLFFQPGAKVLVVPKEDTNVSWKRLRSSQDRSLAQAYNNDLFALESVDLDDPLTPISNKLSRKLSKAWAPVDTKVRLQKKRPKPKKSSQPLREQRAHVLTETLTDFGLSTALASRYERLASSNKKTLRQLMKRVTEREFEASFPALQ
jgi:hypothetical protein